MCAHRVDKSLGDVTIAWDDETGDKVQLTSRTGSARRILGISKTPKEEVRLFGLAEARRICAPWVPHEIGARWRSQHKKIVSLSLFRNLSLKSNKKVSYLNKEVVTCFRISRFLCSTLCIYVTNIRCPYRTWPYLALIVNMQHNIDTVTAWKKSRFILL